MNAGDRPLFDAARYYTAGPWRCALNAKNLAAKKRVVACFGSVLCRRGDPLTVLATVQYNWT